MSSLKNNLVCSGNQLFLNPTNKSTAQKKAHYILPFKVLTDYFGPSGYETGRRDNPKEKIRYKLLGLFTRSIEMNNLEADLEALE